jgi:CRP/FNR family transcriptional regulator, cyclic AMP receptor protein
MLIDKSWDRPTTRDWENVLSALPLFSTLSARQRRQLAKLAQFAWFARGEVIVRAGDAGDAFYLVVSGKASVEAKPRTRTLGAGDFFGEMSLIDGEPRSATITATTELQAMILPRRSFVKVVQQEPRLALALMAELAARVRRLERSL